MMSPLEPPLSIPRINDEEPLSIDMLPGDVLFVLGANGTGKSGLVQHLYKEYRDKAIRITAHRQTWMGSSQVGISPRAKRQQENQIRERDVLPTARWQDPHADSRYQLALLNLIQARNTRNADAIHAYHEGKQEEFEALSSEKNDPLSILNRILHHSNIPITINIQRDEEITAIKGSHHYSYGIAEMSDAERSILLLAADVLTCPENALVLIDEPERHIHRSISSSIIKNLLSYRPDCFFVISTHELMLPIDIDSSKILMLRDCVFQGKDIVEWDADFISSASEIDDSLKKNILGSRRKLLFVEGNNHSLDNALYSILFPGVSIIPKDGRRNVENSVKAVNGAGGFHWLRAYGIVDDDGYSDERKEKLRSQEIHPLDVYEIESIFYDSTIQSILFPENYRKEKLLAARQNALKVFSDSSVYLARIRAEQRRRETILSYLKEPLDSQQNESIPVNSKDIMQNEIDTLRSMIEREEYDSIIRRYPVRDTPAPDRIAHVLGIRSRRDYELEILHRLPTSQAALEHAKSLLGGLPDRIADDSASSASQ